MKMFLLPQTPRVYKEHALLYGAAAMTDLLIREVLAKKMQSEAMHLLIEG